MQKILNYLEYLAIVIVISIIKLIGIDAASNVIGAIARFIGPFHKSSFVAKKNLKVAFPKISKPEMDRILKDMWENLGRTAAEFSFISNFSKKETESRLKIHNPNLLSKTKPFILVGGHFANWEIATKALILSEVKASIVYRHSNNPLVDKLINKLRSNKDIDHIPKDRSVIKILKALKEKRSIAFLVDQKLNTGIKVKFLGKNAMTTNMPAKLALRFNMPIIYGRIVRNKGAHFTLELQQIKTPKTNIENASIQITQTINDLIEKDAKKYPDQWFWVHKRFDKEFYK